MMQAANTHPLAASYLERLRTAAGDLPAGDAADLVVDVGEHLDVALADIDRRDAQAESQVRAVLERLGEPSDLVAAASEQTTQAAPVSSAPAGSAVVDTASLARARRAVWFLLAAGLIAVLWPVAVVFWGIGLWNHVKTAAWTSREKLWGGLVLGGAFPLNASLLGGAGLAAFMSMETNGECSIVNGVQMCAQSQPISPEPAELIFGLALGVTLVVLQLLTAGILLRRLNRKAA